LLDCAAGTLGAVHIAQFGTEQYTVASLSFSNGNSAIVKRQGKQKKSLAGIILAVDMADSDSSRLN
jgi:hypothetical protein